MSISLTARQAFIQARSHQGPDRIAEHIKAIVFLGTPHRGSSFTRLGRLAALALRPLGSDASLLAEVDYDSEFLLDLQRMFEGLVADDVHVVNFFEQRPTRLFKIWFIVWEQFVSAPATGFIPFITMI